MTAVPDCAVAIDSGKISTQPVKQFGAIAVVQKFQTFLLAIANCHILHATYFSLRLKYILLFAIFAATSGLLVDCYIPCKQEYIAL